MYEVRKVYTLSYSNYDHFYSDQVVCTYVEEGGKTMFKSTKHFARSYVVILTDGIITRITRCVGNDFSDPRSLVTRSSVNGWSFNIRRLNM